MEDLIKIRVDLLNDPGLKQQRSQAQFAAGGVKQLAAAGLGRSNNISDE